MLVSHCTISFVTCSGINPMLMEVILANHETSADLFMWKHIRERNKKTLCPLVVFFVLDLAL